MAFQFKTNEPVAKGIKRMARGQIDKALDELTGLSGDDPEEIVHDARKRFKKLRAVLRLGRGGLGRKLYDRENTRFRDAGRPLSEVRNAGVLLKTFDQLVERSGDLDRPGAVAAVRSALRDRKHEVFRRVLNDQHVLADVAAATQEARRGVSRWEIDEDDWTALEGGLKRIYGKGYRAYQTASDDLTDETLHEWRKRVKDLWYVFDILQPIRPDFTNEQAEHAHQLADDLGDDHDLAVLRQVLSNPALPIADRSAVEAILPLIDRRRSELQQKAFDLGRGLYGEKPKDFVKRICAYWQAWRSENEAAQFGLGRGPGSGDGKGRTAPL